MEAIILGPKPCNFQTCISEELEVNSIFIIVEFNSLEKMQFNFGGHLMRTRNRFLNLVATMGFIGNLAIAADKPADKGAGKAADKAADKGPGEHCTPANKKALCNEQIIKDKVDWACKTIAEKGADAGKAEIKKMRFDCCGEPDYVWINDMHPKMIMHPIKPQLDGQDITNNADPDGKKLFVEFVKAVKAKPDGDWVTYKWTKLGESDPTPKKSWVRKCKPKDSKDEWVVGSGTWY